MIFVNFGPKKTQYTVKYNAISPIIPSLSLSKMDSEEPSKHCITLQKHFRHHRDSIQGPLALEFEIRQSKMLKSPKIRRFCDRFRRFSANSEPKHLEKYLFDRHLSFYIVIHTEIRNIELRFSCFSDINKMTNLRFLD